MKYERKSFSVSPGAARISQENWERTFGKKQREECPDVPTPKETVPVSGVWVRTSERERPISIPARPGPAPLRMWWTVIEVLVEVGGQWRLIQTHWVRPIDQTISHITETAGIQAAPVNVL